ncbi:MAG TPA: gas vesicle protein GvpO [Terrabacter sp.]|nr:gas vesicle protein GvpO [Terrabacter sp.]
MSESSSETEQTSDEGATKAPAKKRAPRKSTPRKSTAKKSTTKANPRKASARTEPSRPKRMSGSRVAAEAVRQLLELTGKGAEGVIGLERTEDGWTVQIEVLELRRIPNTTDVLAAYEVTVDSDGELEGYRRLRRYVRGTPGDA